MLAVGDVCGVWDGRRDRVYVFERRLDRRPPLQLDTRAIIAAQRTPPSERRAMLLTKPLAGDLEKIAVERLAVAD